MGDPWSMSPWSPSPVQPKIPGVEMPRAVPHPPRGPRPKRPVPAIDDLFDIQKDLIKVVNALASYEQKHNDADHDVEFRRAKKNSRNAYRILSRYLHRWGEGTSMGF